jgi:hypothetical protein
MHGGQFILTGRLNDNQERIDSGGSGWMGENHAMRAFRRHSTWYTKGFRGSAQLRGQLMRVSTLEGLKSVLDQGYAEDRFPATAMRVPRGKTSGRRRVALPANYLDDRNDTTPPSRKARNNRRRGRALILGPARRLFILMNGLETQLAGRSFELCSDSLLSLLLTFQAFGETGVGGVL